LRDPFTAKDEARLAWYFEEHLRFPFTKQVRAREATASLISYGEALFRQIFADHNAYASYKTALQLRVSTLQLEVQGSPAFHALHWEALKDPDLPQPLVLLAPMIRKHGHPQPLRALLQPSPTINILIVSARPSGQWDMGYRTISRPLVEALRQAHVPVQVDLVRPCTYQALDQHLRDVTARRGAGYYQVIHFDVHGALLTYEQFQQGGERSQFLCNERYGRYDLAPYEGQKAFLFLEGSEEARADPVEASELARLLLQHQIPVAILNACQSGKQVGARETSLGSQLLQAGVQLVLAMSYSVTVSAAALLMRTLYAQLFSGLDLATAIQQARMELANQKARRVYYNQLLDLEDWVLPVVYQHQPVQLAIRPFTPEEAKVYHERQAQRFVPPEPKYGFVGRDLNILQIEKRLLTRCNLLLVEGMGGAGKTTLLRHLGAWWQQTGLVQQVFYFGYDERAWTRHHVLDVIARQLLTPIEYVGTFQPMGLEAQQSYLCQKLRAERHLIILDNLESITGADLAIQHTLPPEEQQALRHFLADLVGGRTLVLLGSRGQERWLAEGTFRENTYTLGGLDEEAASVLAERILERHRVTKYRRSPKLLEVLKLLDGFPLAFEVVLFSLVSLTPEAVLSALKEGQIELVDTDSQKRTRSILRCIDYAYGNLAPALQQLLLCLAPFTSVIYINALEIYIEQLQKQPALEGLPYECWEEVLSTAAHWGLVQFDELSGFLRLQPVLPFFLRSRLGTSEQAVRHQAVETAFIQLYEQWGTQLFHLLRSQNPEERLTGRVLVKLEYENLRHAVNLAITSQRSIAMPFQALTAYLEITQEPQRGVELAEQILAQLNATGKEQENGPQGVDRVLAFDRLGDFQADLHRYKEAETSYRQTLTFLQKNQHLQEAERKRHSASMFHQLGRVAQAQREWEKAEEHFKQALENFREVDDRQGQASTYHHLLISA
jgi:tetratricopeptide (TPR) repeat protein